QALVRSDPPTAGIKSFITDRRAFRTDRKSWSSSHERWHGRGYSTRHGFDQTAGWLFGEPGADEIFRWSARDRRAGGSERLPPFKVDRLHRLGTSYLRHLTARHGN